MAELYNFITSDKMQAVLTLYVFPLGSFIIGLLVNYRKKSIKQANETKEETRKTNESIKELKNAVADIKMELLKVRIMNKDMPLQERVSAGYKYISLGGNGVIKAEYERLSDEYKGGDKR